MRRPPCWVHTVLEPAAASRGRPSLFVTSNIILLCGGLYGELYERLYNKVLSCGKGAVRGGVGGRPPDLPALVHVREVEEDRGEAVRAAALPQESTLLHALSQTTFHTNPHINKST